jgi:hypothetical protein
MIGRDPCEDIREYGRQAKCGGISCALDRCPRCNAAPLRFKRYGVRKRLFLVFANWMIRRVFSYLTRWKCPLCKRTFTLYPSFALPFKRYVLDFIRVRCAAYVEDEARTYREGVEEKEGAISHEDADGGAELWPSTLWRWVKTMGRLPVTVRLALNLIKQKDPSTGIFRALGRMQIRAGKFRSEACKTLLIRCRELTLADSVYRALFSVSFFPDLATRCGWR